MLSHLSADCGAILLRLEAVVAMDVLQCLCTRLTDERAAVADNLLEMVLECRNDIMPLYDFLAELTRNLKQNLISLYVVVRALQHLQDNDIILRAAMHEFRPDPPESILDIDDILINVNS